jgi:hypothetical protein
LFVVGLVVEAEVEVATLVLVEGVAAAMECATVAVPAATVDAVVAASAGPTVPNTAAVTNVAVVTGTAVCVTVEAGTALGAGAAGATVLKRTVWPATGVTVVVVVVAGATALVVLTAFAAAGAGAGAAAVAVGAAAGVSGCPLKTLSKFPDAVFTRSKVRTVLFNREPKPLTVFVSEIWGREMLTGAAAGVGVISLLACAGACVGAGVGAGARVATAGADVGVAATGVTGANVGTGVEVTWSTEIAGSIALGASTTGAGAGAACVVAVMRSVWRPTFSTGAGVGVGFALMGRRTLTTLPSRFLTFTISNWGSSTAGGVVGTSATFTFTFGAFISMGS